MIDNMMDAAMSFAIFMAVFLPLERLFPGHRQKILRREWGTDFLFFLGQYLLWTTPVVAGLVFIHNQVDSLPLAGVRAAVAAQPFWLQFFEVIFLCDLGIYWAHRWSHKNKFLWKFHKVHHTAEKIDWIAAYREHPFDNLYTRLVENIPAILLGFPIEALAGFAVFRGMWALYIHSNVSLAPGFLKYVLGSPRLHHWHHEIAHSGRVNFANLSPLMDLMFGTFHDPGHFPEAGRYGIPENVARSYPAQLLEPLLPRSLSRHWGLRSDSPRGEKQPGVPPREDRAAVIAVDTFEGEPAALQEPLHFVTVQGPKR